MKSTSSLCPRSALSPTARSTSPLPIHFPLLKIECPAEPGIEECQDNEQNGECIRNTLDTHINNSNEEEHPESESENNRRKQRGRNECRSHCKQAGRQFHTGVLPTDLFFTVSALPPKAEETHNRNETERSNTLLASGTM